MSILESNEAQDEIDRLIEECARRERELNALRSELAQSQRQAAAMREALEILANTSEPVTPGEWLKVRAALSSQAGRGFLSPADVERVRRALSAALGTHGDPCPEPQRATCQALAEFRTALAIIEKAGK